jgi:hypothetical protein
MATSKREATHDQAQVAFIAATILAPIRARAETFGEPPNQFTVTLSEDHRFLEIHTDKCTTGTGQCPTTMRFAGEATDALITYLGEYRQQMTPPIPELSATPGQKMQVEIANPGQFHGEEDQNKDSFIISILHPSYGWIGLNVTYAQLMDIRQKLETIHPPK